MTNRRTLRFGVRCCAGCAPWYDQRGVLRSLCEESGGEVELRPTEAGEYYEALLIVLGCPRGAADRCAPCPENLRAGRRVVVHSREELARAWQELLRPSAEKI